MERQRAILYNDAITKRLRTHEIDIERLHCEWKALRIYVSSTERIDDLVREQRRVRVIVEGVADERDCVIARNLILLICL